MTDIAKKLFDDLESFKDLKYLIDSGETEGIYLECKAPSSPKINQDVKTHIAKALSGFSNTEGGLVIWGLSTTKHSHSGLDIITQIEPIGSCEQFKKQIEKISPLLNTPPITNILLKTIKNKPHDTKGVVLAYIQKSNSFPVQSLSDNLFYFRSGDEFSKAPYELVKRLFSATNSPDISPILSKQPITKNSKGAWEIPIALTNISDAVGRDIKVIITILNDEACNATCTTHIDDISSFNKGRKVFLTEMKDDVLHNGLNHKFGNLLIEMKGQKKKLLIKIKILADKMHLRSYEYSIMLQGKKPRATLISSDD